MNKVKLLQDSSIDYRIQVPGNISQTRICCDQRTQLGAIRSILNHIPGLTLEEVAAILTVLSTSEECRTQVANTLGIIYDSI